MILQFAGYEGGNFWELGWWYLVNPQCFLLMQRMGVWMSFDSDLSWWYVLITFEQLFELSANPFPMLGSDSWHRGSWCAHSLRRDRCVCLHWHHKKPGTVFFCCQRCMSSLHFSGIPKKVETAVRGFGTDTEQRLSINMNQDQVGESSVQVLQLPPWRPWHHPCRCGGVGHGTLSGLHLPWVTHKSFGTTTTWRP